MKYLNRLLGASAIALVAACASSPMSDIAATEVSFTGAVQVATAYKGLPLCTATGVPICHVHSVTAQLDIYIPRAAEAITDAKTIVANTGSSPTSIQAAIAAATVAVAAVTDITSTLKTQ